LRRYRKHIKKAVTEAVNKRSITDIESGEKITIPSRDVSEPTFHHGPGGKRTIIHPGNKEFVAGDRFPRPKGGGGGQGSGQASDSGEGEDEFAFQITQEEFLNFMFDDLELPNMVKRQLQGTDAFKYVRAGFSSAGTPAKLNVVRSLRNANARRIALGGKKRKRLKDIQALLSCLDRNEALSDSQANEALLAELTRLQNEPAYRAELEAEALELKGRIKRVPFIDDLDLRYNLSVKQPIPSSKAVMFCLMDVSGSMDQKTKDMAKRFFILLYLFLKRNYDRIEVVFIRHHTSAKEVDEEEFFYSRETGGTIVSSALKLMHEVMEERYPSSEWNIYGAQASDGDNWNDDSANCYSLMTEKIMANVQHFSYVEITPRDHQSLWQEYERVRDCFPDTFAMQQIVDAADIYPVFHELFQRKRV
jgi:hypothetical protein